MITFKRCTEANEDAIYQAFRTGFSDYILKIDMPMDLFLKHFLGPEGNSLEYSVIAFDGEKPIGLNLGGIREFDGLITLRCGALCVHPDYRGTGVSTRLFELHREIALENHCRQMYLEVIAGNDRAIRFYEKMGYEKVYDLVYYSHDNPAEIHGTLPSDLKVRRIGHEDLISLSEKIPDIHINWQNSFDYIRHIDGQIHYGVFRDARLVGALSMHPSGRINFLWVESGFRNRGIAKGLINHAAGELHPKKLAISFSGNAKLMGFVKRLNFKKDALSQHEMYMFL
ncbi:MAG TPA: GNAT family N-acetyltransferase [Thermoclostridium caenicola]|uniref:Acetyltransferase (GNAT) domain-containing protein n=1 Tax=Thermoclostridium caenicola TaxID=659425 RepID=A0A1M6AM45_9FIRM|nr:GNAT family N-acetyltransferase [Thermoclostridium caenicola]SHI37532.1 Acetyltransferase (GNAT) domain-containing protein [Thermoclostridium caenicola]HOK42240.1 GNAT family N-acetyltransferase [Thermoclostridium caenicola]HOL84869.1 GNAT family N-acetyltransferase [Thermoclostridium caenicola]HPO76086.1 GNAT family N-acetyltransferase [Thermoclostridium caenicola]HPU21548.1 GNAT family N-acetyltransferase [Thermoclostridium caenicola]